MTKEDILKEYGTISIPIRGYSTFYHIKEVTETQVILEDKCPRDSNIGFGDSLKLNIDIKDEDDVKFRERCKKIIKYAKKHNRCPEVGIDLEISAFLQELV